MPFSNGVRLLLLFSRQVLQAQCLPWPSSLLVPPEINSISSEVNSLMFNEVGFLFILICEFFIISSVYNQVIKAVNYLLEMNFDAFIHQHLSDILLKIQHHFFIFGH